MLLSHKRRMTSIHASISSCFFCWLLFTVVASTASSRHPSFSLFRNGRFVDRQLTSTSTSLACCCGFLVPRKRNCYDSQRQSRATVYRLDSKRQQQQQKPVSFWHGISQKHHYYYHPTAQRPRAAASSAVSSSSTSLYNQHNNNHDRHVSHGDSEQPSSHVKASSFSYSSFVQQVNHRFHLPPIPNVVSTLIPQQRLVAIGDVHGDLLQLQRSLQLAGVLQLQGQPSAEEPFKTTHHWCGNNTICVICGDVLDRGLDELSCLALLCDLARQAQRVGGMVTLLWGNHEAMNAKGEFVYAYKRIVDNNNNKDSNNNHHDVTNGATNHVNGGVMATTNLLREEEEEEDEFEKEFGSVLDQLHAKGELEATSLGVSNSSSWRDAYLCPYPSMPINATTLTPIPTITNTTSSSSPAITLQSLHFQDAARWAAMEPGGWLAKPLLSHMNVALIVGRTVLVHGGLAMHHLELAHATAAAADAAAAAAAAAAVQSNESSSSSASSSSTSTESVASTSIPESFTTSKESWGRRALAIMNQLARDWILSSPMDQHRVRTTPLPNPWLPTPPHPQTNQGQSQQQGPHPFARYLCYEASIPPFLRGSAANKTSPVWMRTYSFPPNALPTQTEVVQAMLEDVLKALDVDRMVMGHTIQTRGINAALDGRLWRIDVGASRGCSLQSIPEVLEITANEHGEEQVRVLSLEPVTIMPDANQKNAMTYAATTAISLPGTDRYVEYQVQNILEL